MNDRRNLELARFKTPAESETELVRYAFLADPDAWKYPRLEFSFTRRIKSLEAAGRWLAEPKPLTFWQRLIARFPNPLLQ